MRSIGLKTTILLFLVFFASGCAVKRPAGPSGAMDVPETFTEAAEAGEIKREPFNNRWWESFGDERLNSLMEEAFRGNLDIRKAYERLDQARASVGVAGSALFPQLNATASGGRTRQRAITGVGSSITTDTFSLAGAAGYEIDFWRKIRSTRDAARFDALASMEDVKTAYVSVSARLADLYYLAMEQRAQLELSDRTIEAFEDTHERVESRYREGLIPALDVYQSRQNLATARAQRPVFASNLAVTEHAISVLVGKAPGEGPAIAGDRGVELPVAPAFPAGLPSELLKRRPDIRATLLRLEAADKRVAAAVADRFPSFNLLGEYGGASSTLGEILDSPNIFWNLLVQAALPVVDGGRRRAEVRRTEAVWGEALAGLRDTVIRSLAEVEDALSKSGATIERIRMLEDRVDASEGALRLSLDRYLQGLSDYLPVLTSQQRFYDSKRELLAARRQLISDRIALARALGGEWPAELVEERLSAKNNKETEVDR